MTEFTGATTMKNHKSAKAKTAKSSKPTERQSKTKGTAKPTVAITTSSDCVYRPETLYGTLFTEGNKDYILKDELLKKVAEMTKKPVKSVEFAFQVLKSKNHRSNCGRSCLIESDDGTGKVKFISLKKPAIG